jgi:23S rRNA (adenine2503-C2)-methyltransferase
MNEAHADPAGPPPVEVLGLSVGEFATEAGRVLALSGEPHYRLAQIEDWVYRKTPASFEEMSNIPRPLRIRLGDAWVLHPLACAGEERSSDGTRKFLWKRPAGTPPGRIESVAIPDGDRLTFCISTQAGCPVRCTFCATGHGGYSGNLRAAEIVDQVVSMRSATGATPTNIVYMGMGEPLLNFDEVCRSLEVLTAGERIALGARRITVSTVGIPDRIRELGRRFPQVKLALSLHAARDALRDELIPLNRKYPLGAVLGAMRDHATTTGKKVTFEYVILPGVNDTEEDARCVIERLDGIPSKINLLSFNPFEGAPYRRPELRQVLRFRSLIERGFPGDVTVRRSRGQDIRGACGQLAAEKEKDPGLGETLPGSKVGRKEKGSLGSRGL